MRFSLLLVLVLAVAGAGCDIVLACEDCDQPPPVRLFAEGAEVSAPESVGEGERFVARVRVVPAFSGVGSVSLVGRAHRLETLVPVADTVGCFAAEAPASCLRVPLGTEPARVTFEAGVPLTLVWRARLFDGPAPENPPAVGAIVRMDSIRTEQGSLVSVYSPEAYEVTGGIELLDQTSADPAYVRIR